MSEHVSLDVIFESPDNPRKIDKKDVDSLKRSIDLYTPTIDGWNPADGYRLPNPIIINYDGEILSGNQRYKALKALGQDWIHKEDIKQLKITDPALKKAFIVKMNTHAGIFDDSKLNDILNEVSDMDGWEDLTGFDDTDLFDIPVEYNEDLGARESSKDDKFGNKIFPMLLGKFFYKYKGDDEVLKDFFYEKIYEMPEPAQEELMLKILYAIKEIIS